MSRPVIRAMRPDDVPLVSAIDHLCFPVPWSEEAFAYEVQAPVAYYRVAEVEEMPVGYIGSHVIMDEAHITTFGMHPEFRRQGIGERLLADVLRHAVAEGAQRITLEVRASNEAAQTLYRKWGFAPISRRKRYYTDNDEDAVVMWVDDTSGQSFRAVLEERLRELEGWFEGGAGGDE